MKVQLAQRINSFAGMDQHLTREHMIGFPFCCWNTCCTPKPTFSRKVIPYYQDVSDRHYPTLLLTQERISATSWQEFQAQKHYTAPAVMDLLPGGEKSLIQTKTRKKTNSFNNSICLFPHCIFPLALTSLWSIPGCCSSTAKLFSLG